MYKAPTITNMFWPLHSNCLIFESRWSKSKQYSFQGDWSLLCIILHTGKNLMKRGLVSIYFEGCLNNPKNSSICKIAMVEKLISSS